VSVRHRIYEQNGLFFITFTCARWIPLIEITNTYSAIYNWFDYLKKEGHRIIGYVIMPNHIHAMIAFSQTEKSINTIVANGKRFMAYEIVKQLKLQGNTAMLKQLESLVNNTDKKRGKLHEVFEPSFDCKEMQSEKFVNQKLDYLHQNPCRYKTILAATPADYLHSSAAQYTGCKNVAYEITTYGALQEIDLTKNLNDEK